MRRTISTLLITMLMLLVLSSAAQAAGIDIVIDAPLNGHNSFYLKTDAAPFLENGRTMVPLRSIAEALGFKVDWQSSNNLIVITSSNKAVVMSPGKLEATVNGTPVTLDVAPKLVGSRTFLPLRFVSETLGYNAYYSTKNVKSGGAVDIFITSYSLIKDDEITAITSGKSNFYAVPGKNAEPSSLNLKASGTTPGGIKIGDTLQAVFTVYGIPAEPLRNLELYSSDWTGTLVYLSTFTPEGKKCNGYTYNIRIEKGKVTAISLKPSA